MFYNLCHWVSELVSSVSVAGKPSDSILDSRLHRISKTFSHCAVPTQLSSGAAHVTYRKPQLHNVCDNCCRFCPDVSQHFGLWWTMGMEPITSCYLMRPNHGCTFSNPLGMQARQLLSQPQWRAGFNSRSQRPVCPCYIWCYTVDTRAQTSLFSLNNRHFLSLWKAPHSFGGIIIQL